MGDEASLSAIIQQLRERVAGVKVYAISFDPRDTEARHGVVAWPAIPHHRLRGTSPKAEAGAPDAGLPATPGALERAKALLRALPLARRTAGLLTAGWEAARCLVEETLFLVRSAREMRRTRIDLLMLGGGGQLADDFGGMWGLPWVILKWSVMARLTGATVIFVSVGAGPLDSRSARFFAKQALRLADFRSFRDDATKQLIAKLGVTGDVYPDVAYLLRVKKRDQAAGAGGRALTVGLNPFPYQDGHYWPGGDPAEYQGYLDTLTEFSGWLVSRGHSVVLFPTQLRADPRVIADLKERLARRVPDAMRAVREATVETVDDLLETLAGLDVAVTGRFHGILLSYLVHRPVVGLSYHPKMDDLMRQMGQEEYVLPMATMSLPALRSRLETIERRRGKIGRELEEAVRRQRRALEEQFDMLFGTTVQ
jgi:polysaccharide pyruvyl transferase WcaK-like protein